jgi:CDP-4-dehydro-6-deoxyglucose reductase, E1
VKNAIQIRIPYGQAVHDEKETAAVIKVLNEHRTIMGREVVEFEERCAEYFGKKFGIMVNSGSSANLVAVELLNLPKGSEVITPLLTFSTTVMPLVKNGLVPVFADVDEGKYVININEVEKLISKKTKAFMIPLLLGNVPELDKLRKLAREHNLYFIEDSCDTFAATYKGKPSGWYSDISTTSFYGSHIITAGGNGGMLLVNKKEWYDRARVLRGWGRSSSIFAESESVEKRFKKKIDGMEYDAKFVFDEVGYNFVPSEMGAAFGNVQLNKLSKFKKTREKNFQTFLKFFKKYEDFFVLPIQDPEVSTQWLAFPLTIREIAPFRRMQIVKYLEENNVQTRPIFTGNILKQPGFQRIEHRVIKKDHYVTDTIMERSFVFGCHQGLTSEQVDRLQELFTTYLSRFR